MTSGSPRRQLGTTLRLFASGVVCALGIVSLPAHAAAASPTITTDKADYAPGEIVLVSGTGFAPSTIYDIPVIRPNGSIVLGDGSFASGWDSVASDGTGGFSYSYQLNGVIGAYEVRVYLSPWSGDRDEAPLASQIFTDNPNHSANDYFMFAKALATGVTTDRKANEPNCNSSNDKQVDFSGSNSQVYGRMHSNADIEISGSNNTFNDTSSSNPEITNGTHDEDCQATANAGNTFSSAPTPTSNWEIDTLAVGVDPLTGWPGNLGSFLNADMQTFPNQAHSVTAAANSRAAGMDCDTGTLTGSGTINITAAHAGQVVCNGVNGVINLAVSGLGTAATPFPITMLSHGSININGSNHFLAPAEHGILAWTDKRFDQDALAIEVSGSNINVTRRAINFTPRGGQSVSGSNNTTLCLQIIGQGSDIANGSNITFGPLAPGCNPTGSIELKKVWSGAPGQTTLNIGTSAGGNETDTQLTGANGAAPLTTGANNVLAGTHFVSETGGLTGYSSSLACVNDRTNPATTVTPGPSNSIVVAGGDVIVCTFTNTREQGSIELKKIWAGSPGTTTLAIGTTAAGSEIDTQSVTGADGTTGPNPVSTGTYFVSESDPGPDYLTMLECIDNTDPVNPVTLVLGANDSVEVAKDQVVVCTFTNTRKRASIELRKVWVGSAGTSTLQIGTTAAGTDVDTETVNGADGTTGPNPVDTGTYFVSETSPGAGWDATLWCTNNKDPLNPVTVTTGANDSVPLDDGDVVICTFTNTAWASVQIVKTEAGTATTGQFTFTLTGGPPPGVNIVKTTNSGGEGDSLEFDDLRAGDYEICETVPTGYSSDLGPDANGDPCESFTLDPGETERIDVDNTPCPSGTLTIRKSMPNILQGAQTEVFTYDVTGPNAFNQPHSIVFTAGELQDTAQVTVPIAGTYTVTEQLNSPYTPIAPLDVDILPPSCDAEADMGSANFAPPTADARKVTLPAGSEAGWSFTLRRNAVPVETVVTGVGGTAAFTTVLNEADYTITETARPGFTQQSASSGCNFTVDLPQDADRTFTCTIVNAADGGGVIVKKEKLPGKKARVAKGRWEFYVHGGPNNIFRKTTLNTGSLKNKMGFGALKAGTYTVCERYFKGWRSSLGGSKGYRLGNGDRCVNFDVVPGKTVSFKVLNTCVSTSSKAKMP